ncbi:DUF1997 domain-containing protein [Pycnococcus provasolii]
MSPSPSPPSAPARIRIQVTDTRRVRIKPTSTSQRSLRAYFSQPVDRFCTLPGVSLRREEDDSADGGVIDRGRFILTVPPVGFFNMLSVTPTVTCTATQSPGESVRVESSDCNLTGRPANLIDVVNNCFVFSASTDIDFDDESRHLCISGTIDVDVVPPPPFDVFPARVLKTTGEAVLGTATAALHRIFMSSLRADYEAFDTEYEVQQN